MPRVAELWAKGNHTAKLDQRWPRGRRWMLPGMLWSLGELPWSGRSGLTTQRRCILWRVRTLFQQPCWGQTCGCWLKRACLSTCRFRRFLVGGLVSGQMQPPSHTQPERWRSSASGMRVWVRATCAWEGCLSRNWCWQEKASYFEEPNVRAWTAGFFCPWAELWSSCQAPSNVSTSVRPAGRPWRFTATAMAWDKFWQNLSADMLPKRKVRPCRNTGYKCQRRSAKGRKGHQDSNIVKAGGVPTVNIPTTIQRKPPSHCGPSHRFEA